MDTLRFWERAETRPTDGTPSTLHTQTIQLVIALRSPPMRMSPFSFKAGTKGIRQSELSQRLFYFYSPGG